MSLKKHPSRTQEKNKPSLITVVHYTATDYHESQSTRLEDSLPEKKRSGITWIDVTGLSNHTLIKNIAEQYQIHPLSMESIHNVDERSKVEEFTDHFFITLRILLWRPEGMTFTTEHLSIVSGKDFVVTFHEHESPLFSNIRDRIRSGPSQRLQEHGSDYLTYRLLDAVVDGYFTVLEGLGEEIETVEELIITSPTQQSYRKLYHLKHQMLMLRKAIWPVREIISHLLQVGELITPFTRLYLRDVYDHTMQAIDTLETYRDMLSSMLDMYLSSLTNQMQEVMKILAMIATIFIPLTFITGLYGMNFKHIPLTGYYYGFYIVLVTMLLVSLGMVLHFKRKKWL